MSCLLEVIFDRINYKKSRAEVIGFRVMCHFMIVCVAIIDVILKSKFTDPSICKDQGAHDKAVINCNAEPTQCN